MDGSVVFARLRQCELHLIHAALSPAKTTESIEMPFGLRTQIGPGNHVLDRGQHPPMEMGNLKGRPTLSYRDTTVICVKTVETIEMLFGLLARMGLRNRVR